MIEIKVRTLDKSGDTEIDTTADQFVKDFVWDGAKTVTVNKTLVNNINAFLNEISIAKTVSPTDMPEVIVFPRLVGG